MTVLYTRPGVPLDMSNMAWLDALLNSDVAPGQSVLYSDGFSTVLQNGTSFFVRGHMDLSSRDAFLGNSTVTSINVSVGGTTMFSLQGLPSLPVALLNDDVITSHTLLAMAWSTPLDL